MWSEYREAHNDHLGSENMIEGYQEGGKEKKNTLNISDERASDFHIGLPVSIFVTFN